MYGSIMYMWNKIDMWKVDICVFGFFFTIWNNNKNMFVILHIYSYKHVKSQPSLFNMM